MAKLSNINGKFAVEDTGAIRFSDQTGTTGQILKSNGNSAPTWVDPNTVGTGPWLPLAGGIVSGATTFQSSLTVGGTLTVNGSGGSVFNSTATTNHIIAAYRASNGNNVATFRTTDSGYIFRIHAQNAGTIYVQNDDGSNYIKIPDSGSNEVSGNTTFAGVVNIGTATGTQPSYFHSYLNVQNNASTSDNASITITAGSSGYAGLHFGDSDNGRIGQVAYNNSNNSLLFTANNSTRMTIDSSGNVGIGITPNVNSSVVNVIQLGKGMTLMGNANDDRATMAANLYLDTGTAFRYVMDGLAGRFSIEDGNMVWGTASSGTAGTVATVDTKMTLLNNGNLGINVSPAGILHAQATSSGNIYSQLLMGYNGASNNFYDGDTQTFRTGIGNITQMTLYSSGNATFAGRIGAETTLTPVWSVQTGTSAVTIPNARYLNFNVGEINYANFSRGFMCSISDDTAVDQPKQIGLIMHNNSKVNNTFSPGIVFGSQANSGNYSDATAMIAGRRLGQVGDSNWSAGQLWFWTATAGAPVTGGATQGLPDGYPAMVINEYRRVMIGTNTASTAGQPNINQALQVATGHSNDGIIIHGNGSNDGMTGGGFRKIGFRFDETDQSFESEIRFVVTNAGAHGGQLEFWTDNSIGTTTRAMTIDKSQNVGIGTDTPYSSLSVIDDNSYGYFSSTSAYRTATFQGSGSTSIVVAANGNSNGVYSEIRLGNTQATYANYSPYVRATQGNGIDSYSLEFGTSSGGVASTVMYIGGATGTVKGNVGIGTTTPGQLLHLNSGSTVTTTDANNMLLLTRNDHSYILFSCPDEKDSGIHFHNTTDNSFVGRIAYSHEAAGDKLFFRVGGSEVFTLFSNGNATLTGTLTQNSDITLKENIKPLQSQLKIVSKLNPVSYNKIGQKENEVGFIAQEVEKLLPELVREDKDGLKSLAYGNMNAILVKAIQELEARIKILENK